jgi:hypothetical protein
MTAVSRNSKQKRVNLRAFMLGPNILALFISALIISTAAAQSTTTRTFKDDMGREIGRADTQGNTTTFRDNMGRETGRAVRSGSGTTFYDSSGRETGRASRR